MPTDELDTISGPELSDIVAREVMGFDEKLGSQWWKYAGDATYFVDSWQTHIDRNDAHRVLMRCKDLGIIVQLEAWIMSVIPVGGGLFWNLLTLDPEIVCRAAIRAVRESRKGGA